MINKNRNKNRNRISNNYPKQKADNDMEVKEGRVVEALPAALFRIEFPGQEKRLLCFLGGKMRIFKIKILVGDKVVVEIDPYGGNGRIVRRL